MSTNPFAMFMAGAKSKVALSQPAAGGWMATKRRGRDDAVIEQDKARALQARKKKVSNKSSMNSDNNKAFGTGGTKPTKRMVVPKKQRKRRDWSDEELDDEDDDFIVDDDDDQGLEEWSVHDDDESEDELVVLEPRKKANLHRMNRCEREVEEDQLVETPESKRKPTMPIRRTFVVDDEKEDEFVSNGEDEDEELESLLPPVDKKRSSVPPNRLKSKFFPPRKGVFESDSSESDSELKNCTKKSLTRNNIVNCKDTKSSTKSMKKTSNENGEILVPKATALTNKRTNGLITQSNIKEKEARLKKKRIVIHLDSDDEGVFSPVRKNVPIVSSTSSSTSCSAFFKNSDDDKTPAKPSVQSRNKNIHLGDDDDDMDDDERMALALALSASQRDTNSVKPKSSVLLLNEDEDEQPEEEDDDEDDASHVDMAGDERREAASKVLETANKLSRQVLQNMMAWSSECKGTAVTQGMIVEGALAMHNFDSVTTSDWISCEEMLKVCPYVKLADYQLIGVNWLALLHKMKVDIGNGEKSNVNGILADVMGLGKTVQTIAFLAWLRSQNRRGTTNTVDDAKVGQGKRQSTTVKPHIIIVPASVLDNWMGEFEKFAPQLVVMKYHGSMSERERLKDNFEQRLPRRKKQNNASCDIDVVLTTFSYFSGNKADDRVFLRRFDYDYMVVDEAHVLKNPDSNAYQNIDKVETAHRLLLTGTPVQNSPKELMSLICFLMPLFKNGSKSSWDDEDGKKNDGGASMLEHFVSLEAEGDNKSDDTAYKKLKHLFAPFVLRRRKEDVLSQSMPPKTREILRVPLDPAMREMYNSILASHIKSKDKKAIPGNASDRLHLFSTLRKVANHPLLLRKRHVTESAIEHLATHLRMYGFFGHAESCTMELVKKEVRTLSDFDVHHAALEVIDENESRRAAMERYILNEIDLFCSPKLEKLRTLIPELVEKGHRLLIFSQWTNCLDLLGCLLETLGMKFFRLDGQTPISTRQDMINDFNKDVTIPVFLLSTKAGGMGINLTAADVCILHDLDFNPFNDLQAEDRCHRIGQTKPVRVIKMVTTDTVDDDIFKMQERKTKMNAAILERGGSIAAEKNRDNEEIKSMLQNQLDRYLSAKEGGIESARVAI